MSKKNEKPTEKPVTPPREIPTVPPSDRVNLNEDFNNPTIKKGKK